MSLVKSVAGTTLRLQQQQQNAKAQQKCTKAGASSQSSSNNNNNNNPTSNHTIATTTSQATTGNCLQPSSPPSSSSKTSLSTSPITATFMGSSTCSSSLFSFESGVVLSGSSGCCSLSNSPSSSSSSSSNSYLTSQTVEANTSGNQVCAHTSTTASHLDESFSSNTCPLNASLLAAVNGDLDDDHVMSKTLSLADSPNQNETNLHVSESMENNSSESVSNGDNGQMLLLENLHQQSTTDNSCLNNEDARTLQLAVELTMMNLNQLPSPSSGAQTISTPVTPATNHFQLHSHHLHNGSSIDHHQQLHQPFSSSSSYNSSVNNPYHMTTKVFLQTQSQAAATSLLNQKFLSDSSQDNNIPSKVSALTSNSNQNLIAAVATDERSKKSQNMTECVPVPSSEHVAEIVGRQGCKIKALRAKTNTYIKTPVRNEEPVFVVTGRKEDVAKAKREILSAAEHFTLIRATRRTNDGINGCSANITSGGGGGYLISLNKNSLSSTTPLPGQVTIQVRVPYRVVGLVVGPKGNTIKHIQHETQTYIVTPSRDKEPIFEVTGMPDNVQMARKQIEAHIATRTGNSLNNALAIPAPPPPPPPPPAPAGTINRLNETLNAAQNTSSASSFHSMNALNQILNDDLHSEILSSIYKNGIGSALEYSQIGSNVINAASKCNTSNTFNGFMNSEINPGTLSLNEIQRRVAHSSGSNNASNFDFINSLMDSNTAQFVNEQNSNFPQLPNSATAIRNLKSVISTINILENSSNGAGSLLQQPNNLSTNALLTRSCSSASSTASSSKSFSNNGNSNNNPFWKSFNGGSSVSATNGSCNGIGSVNNDCIDVDEGIGESPLYSWGLPNTLAALTNSYCSPASTSISPTDSLFGEHVHTKAAAAILQQQNQIKSSSKTKLLEKVKRSNCWMCQEKDIFAALLPCGHKMFCYDCANRLCQQNEASCPVCSTQIYQAVRIQN